MRYSENIAHIAEALALVQAEIKNPIKNKTNGGVAGAPKYANLEDTLQDYVRPVCSKHGIAIFQSIKTDEIGRVGVCTVLLHESGEYIEGDYVFCEIKIPLNKSGYEILTLGQATGVNITYLRRYSLNAALGINGDKDTDGDYDKHDAPAPAPAPRHRTAPKPAPVPQAPAEQTAGEKLLGNVKVKRQDLTELYQLAFKVSGVPAERVNEAINELYHCNPEDLTMEHLLDFKSKLEARQAKQETESEAVQS